MRETFAVGRTGGRRRTVVWLRRRREPSFPGPWKVRAVVSASGGHGRFSPAVAAPAPDSAPAAPANPSAPSRALDDGGGQLELFRG